MGFSECPTCKQPIMYIVKMNYVHEILKNAGEDAEKLTNPEKKELSKRRRNQESEAERQAGAISLQNYRQRQIEQEQERVRQSQSQIQSQIRQSQSQIQQNTYIQDLRLRVRILTDILSSSEGNQSGIITNLLNDVKDLLKPQLLHEIRILREQLNSTEENNPNYTIIVDEYNSLVDEYNGLNF